MNETGNVSQRSIKKLFTRDFSLGFLAFLVFLTAMSALFPTLPIFLARLGSSEREIGVLVGVSSVSSLISRFLAGGALTKYSEKKVMVFGALLFALTF
ncbi:MAG TPA: MFS transporter, partial [Syntrophorhabdaceae bacterium]|nr:MFS transporter [Syntrophorhabdaceae bacterium]